VGVIIDGGNAPQGSTTGTPEVVLVDLFGQDRASRSSDSRFLGEDAGRLDFGSISPFSHSSEFGA
jgi:hypothetical protein